MQSQAVQSSSWWSSSRQGFDTSQGREKTQQCSAFMAQLWTVKVTAENPGGLLGGKKKVLKELDSFICPPLLRVGFYPTPCLWKQGLSLFFLFTALILQMA